MNNIVKNAIAAQKAVATNARDVDWLDAVHEVNYAIEKAVEIAGQNALIIDYFNSILAVAKKEAA